MRFSDANAPIGLENLRKRSPLVLIIRPSFLYCLLEKNYKNNFMNNKIMIGLCLLTSALYSCSKKSPNETSSDANLKMTYYFNDSLVTITGNGFRNNNTTTYLYVGRGTAYTLNGQDSGIINQVSNNIQINFVHDTLIGNSLYSVPDSLQVQTYDFSTKTNSSYPALDIVRYNGLVRQFEIVKATDHFTFTISRYSNGTIDGTFSGVLSGMGGVGSVAEGQTGVITNGQFSNVPVIK